jgi:hypothetical protein
MSSRKAFTWAFIITAIVMATSCAFFVWLVYYIVGPQ